MRDRTWRAIRHLSASRLLQRGWQHGHSTCGASQRLVSHQRTRTSSTARMALRCAMRTAILAIVVAVSIPLALHAQKPRERDLGIPIGGVAGPLDAITDVAGVEVGHTTLIVGSGKLVTGTGP